jgi:hypothetical protein
MQACIPNGFLVSIKSASRPTSDEISGVVCFVVEYLLWLILVACIGVTKSPM